MIYCVRLPTKLKYVFVFLTLRLPMTTYLVFGTPYCTANDETVHHNKHKQEMPMTKGIGDVRLSVLYFIVFYFIVLYCIALYCIILYQNFGGRWPPFSGSCGGHGGPSPPCIKSLQRYL